MLALLMAVSLHKAPTGVEVHRDGDAVRIERGDEVVLAEGDYVEVLAFGRLWVIDGTRVKDLPPMPAHGESKVLVNAMDKAAEAGCPVGVEQLSSVASTGALTVTLGKDREQVCELTIGIHTLDVARYTGPPPVPPQLTLGVGETRDWHGMRFELETWEDLRGFTTVQLTVEKKGDQVMLAAPAFEADPLFYMEAEAFGRLLRVAGIEGGVVILDEELPRTARRRLDQLDHVPADARELGCTVPNETFLYDERRGSAVLTFRDDDGVATCVAVVGLVTGEVVAAAPQ